MNDDESRRRARWERLDFWVPFTLSIAGMTLAIIALTT